MQVDGYKYYIVVPEGTWSHFRLGRGNDVGGSTWINRTGTIAFDGNEHNFLTSYASADGWTDATWSSVETVTIYTLPDSLHTYKYDESTSYTWETDGSDLKANIQLGDTYWNKIAMENTGYKYKGKDIYSCSFIALYGGVKQIQFQLYNGETYKGEYTYAPDDSWAANNAFAGKIYVGYRSETHTWVDYATTITLDDNGGTGGSSSVGATIGSSTLSSAITAPTHASGYTFVGYYSAAVGGTRVIDASGNLVANVSGYTDESGNWIHTELLPTLYAHWGGTVDETHFYKTYNYNNTDYATLVSGASFPEYIYAAPSRNGYASVSATSPVVVPEDFSQLEQSHRYFYLGFQNNTTLTITAANVKAVHFYGWSSNTDRKIVTTAKMVRGSGSDLSIGDVTFTYGDDGTVRDYVVNLSSATGYSSTNFYEYTFTFKNGDNWIWGVYVETNETATLTYNVNGGNDDGPADDATWALGATKLLSETVPTRDGYIFKEWNTEDDGTGDGYYAGTAFTMTQTTLYAIWGKRIEQNDFYQLYTSGTNTIDEIIAAAGFPSYITTTVNDKYSWGGIAASSIDVPHDFTGISGSTRSFFKLTSGKTIKLSAVGNVKAVRFYGWNNGTGATISTSVTKVNGSGSAPTISAVDVASVNGTVAEHIIYISTTDGSTARANYSASDLYDITFTFNSGSLVGMYVETNDNVTLTYSGNGDGATNLPSDESWAPNERKHLSSTAPTRTGSIFKEWNTEDDGTGDGYQPGDAYTIPTSNTSLYAIWGTKIAQNNFYSFYATTDVGGDGDESDEKKAARAAALISAAGLPSYITTTFNKAYWWGDGSLSSTIDVPHDFTGFGSGGNRAYIAPQTDHETFTISAVGNVKAVRFYGWNDGTGATISTSVTKVNGAGSAPTISAVNVASVNGTVAEHIIYISTTDGSTARDNYSANDLYDFTFTFSGGSWLGMYIETNDTYTLTYDDNGGSSGPGSASWAPNATDHLSSTTPTKSGGYVFTGWNTENDGTGTSYASNAVYTMPSTNTTLYATWKFVIYHTGDKVDESQIESFAGGAISWPIEYRMKVNAIDRWYSLYLPFDEVDSVQVWDDDDDAYYDLVPYYMDNGTLKTGHYIIRTPESTTDLALADFGNWNDPERPTGYLPSANTPYIIQWHHSYFENKYVSFFGHADDAIPNAMTVGEAPSSNNVVNIYGNDAMTTGSVAGAYLLEGDYGTWGAWLRLEDVTEERTILPFECYILANSVTRGRYRVLRRGMSIEETATGWEDVLNSERKDCVEVYTITGHRLTQYNDCSFSETAQRLNAEYGAGLYILRAGNESVKLMTEGGK